MSSSMLMSRCIRRSFAVSVVATVEQAKALLDYEEAGEIVEDTVAGIREMAEANRRLDRDL